MIQKYMRVELGTGYCGEDEVRYYLLRDQEQTELTETDYEMYEELAIGHNESYGHEYADYCDEYDADPETGELWDEYVCHCCECGSYEIVELDDEDEDAFADGTLDSWQWN